MDSFSWMTNIIPTKAGISYTYMARNSKTVIFKVIPSHVNTFLLFSKVTDYLNASYYLFCSAIENISCKTHDFHILHHCLPYILPTWPM